MIISTTGSGIHSVKPRSLEYTRQMTFAAHGVIVVLHLQLSHIIVFNFFRKSNAPTETYEDRNCHMTATVLDDCSIHPPSPTSNKNPPESLSSRIKQKHFAKCGSKHNTTFSKALQSKHSNAHNLTDTVLYNIRQIESCNRRSTNMNDDRTPPLNKRRFQKGSRNISAI